MGGEKKANFLGGEVAGTLPPIPTRYFTIFFFLPFPLLFHLPSPFSIRTRRAKEREGQKVTPPPSLSVPPIVTFVYLLFQSAHKTFFSLLFLSPRSSGWKRRRVKKKLGDHFGQKRRRRRREDTIWWFCLYSFATPPPPPPPPSLPGAR